MIEVIVIVEGQTEETFVRDVLAPAFAADGVFLQARLMPTSRIGRGGALSYERVSRYLRNTLRHRNDTYVTTFFDLYRLHKAFPGIDESVGIPDPLERSRFLENRLESEIVREVGCREGRFFAHIQPFEFEALLFSDIGQFRTIEPEWHRYTQVLTRAREEANSPEHINDGEDTHPSARLANILSPKYRKTLHGPRLAARIGLARISEECGHFSEWIGHIRSLTPIA